ncbi:hypothetical protein Ahy_B09g097162 isoform A [Arachis hypogaea]|uniref:Reverse transcriptase domain-containing protein n=1 Tax=Arachis hypogaea TaxID=3818 RepID=A0A444XNI2_ARAHY|nr:hypothetical protein Ahy_B09g097162 isoform A [Arachis hypogaea]
MQRDQESMYEYWSRFKRLLESCPHHGMTTRLLISYFTGGLCAEDRRLLITSSGGSLSKNKTEGEAWDLIKDVAESTQHTRVRNNPLKGVVEPSPSEASLTKALGDMATILTQIQRDQREYYSIKAIQAPPPVAQLEGPPRICGLCSSTTHYTDQCHQIQEEHALVVANVNYNNRPPYPSQGQNNCHQGSNQHQGWRDNAQGSNQNQRWYNPLSHHHNNTNYQANQNQNNYTKYQTPHHRQQNQTPTSSNNQVDELRAAMEKRDEINKAQFEALNTQLANLTNILSKMNMSNQPPTPNNNTTQPSSSSNLPSQPQPNPRGGLNAITLRSETTLEEIPPRVMGEMHEEEVVVGAPHEEEVVDKRHEEEGVNLKEPKRKAVVDESIPIPFPSMVKKAKKTPEFDLDMLQVFKKVEVTIPLLDAIQQIPKYAKFLKDLCTHKDRIGESETLSLGSSISSLMEPIPRKCGDPEPCLVSCCIGGYTFHDCMCDLGACVCIMPLSIYVRLNLAPLKKSAARFALADKSVITVMGIAEDVLVAIKDLVFPVDFYILEMPPTEGRSSSSILLGRPFLKTSKFKLDAFTGVYSFGVGDKTIKFNLEEAMKHPPEEHSMLRCDIIDEVVAEVQEEDHDKSCYPTVEEMDDQEDELKEVAKNESHEPDEKEPHLEVASELKPLPSHLKYAFLEDNCGFPVIIASELSSEEEEKLLDVLRKYKKAIGWSLADIVGINPHKCMHRIFLQDGAKPVRQPQRRLNPTILDVVKKEVTRLLDADIIYPISDSEWVSPVQVVPKKSGITTVKKEDGEMVTKRVQNVWRVCIDYRRLNAATWKDHYPLPFIDQMLDRLAGKSHYCFLDGFTGYFQIHIAPEDQKKTTFTCLFGTFAYKRMPFGLCNAPATFQRCMMSVFSDLMENCLEVFMDDFSVYGVSFDCCLESLAKVLARCVDTNLVLNFEKCHFMVRQGIVLGHVVSHEGISVDPAKVDVITTLPHPSSVREVRSFLGHAGFYRRFIKDFSKIALPLSRLLQKDVDFEFDSECVKAFEELSKIITVAPIVRGPN